MGELLKRLRESAQSFFAGVSLLVSRVLLGKDLFAKEYEKVSREEEYKELIDTVDKIKEDQEKKIYEKHEKQDKTKDQEKKESKVPKTEKTVQVTSIDPDFDVQKMFDYISEQSDSEELESKIAFSQCEKIDEMSYAALIEKNGTSYPMTLTSNGVHVHGDDTNTIIPKFQKDMIEKACLEYHIATNTLNHDFCEFLRGQVQASIMENSINTDSYFGYNVSANVDENNLVKIVLEDNIPLYEGYLNAFEDSLKNEKIYEIFKDSIVQEEPIKETETLEQEEEFIEDEEQIISFADDFTVHDEESIVVDQMEELEREAEEAQTLDEILDGYNSHDDMNEEIENQIDDFYDR